MPGSFECCRKVIEAQLEAEAWLQTQQIIAVLRALPPRQRQVLALTIDEWSPAEISELLGIDPAAVRSNLLLASSRWKGSRQRYSRARWTTSRTRT